MTSQADLDAFLERLPRLSPHSILKFNCGPSVACFNQCCSDLNLLLSPYDVLRLRLALNIDSGTFIQKYGRLTAADGNRFPSIALKMTAVAGAPCPFVRENGCSVYGHRPGACRAYPIGRGASIDDEGKFHEEYVLVQESHCQGFDSTREMTVAAYLQDQGMRQYTRFDDLYIRLMHQWHRRDIPLSPPLFEKVFTAVYRTDTLGDILSANSPKETDAPLPGDPLAVQEALLEKAMEWLASDRL